jgi:recombination protein RecR
MIPSKFLENAVNELASLPGVGRKTALRYALNLLTRSDDEVKRFTDAIDNLKENLQYCESCFNISDSKLCEICRNPKRENEIICVVEDIRDVMAIEATQQFKGLYHVLGGKISPMDGIGPSDLKIEQLLSRLENTPAKEIILALSPTMEGDTTAYYLFKKIGKIQGIEVSTLSRGVAVGDELQYADEITLGRSILQRTPYEKAIHG